MSVAARVEKAVLGLKAPLTVAVMGCTVNGPGEAKEADIGLACGRGGGVIFTEGQGPAEGPGVPHGRRAHRRGPQARFPAPLIRLSSQGLYDRF